MRISPIVFISLVSLFVSQSQYTQNPKDRNRRGDAGRGAPLQSILSHERQEEEGESSSSWWTTGSALLRAPSWGGRPLTLCFLRSGLRLWGKGVVTHPPQDVRMWSTWKFPILQKKNKKKRQLPFPDVTLQDGKSTVVVDAETETKKRVTGPDDQLQKPTKKARERESKNSNSAATRRWPPRPRGQASWRGVPSWPW